MTEKPEISWDLFVVVSTLLTRFIAIERDTGLKVQEIYLLTHVKQFGKDYATDGEKIILRQDATKILGDVFEYNDKQVSYALDNLLEVGCIREHDLTPAEKNRLFGKPGGRLAAVIILTPGYEKIDEFTAKLHEIYLDLTAKVPQIVLKPIAHAAKAKPLVQSIAEWLRKQRPGS